MSGDQRNIDENTWAKARQYGVSFPKTPTIITFEEQEQIVLSLVAGYADGYFPELIAPLALTGELSQNSPQASKTLESVIRKSGRVILV